MHGTANYMLYTNKKAVYKSGVPGQHLKKNCLCSLQLFLMET